MAFALDFITDQLWPFTSLPVRVKMGHSAENLENCVKSQHLRGDPYHMEKE